MPEAPELKLTSNFINHVIDNNDNPLHVTHVSKSNIHKGVNVDIKNSTLSAISKGKELILTFKSLNDGSFKHLRMTMGMSGHFKLLTKTEHIFDHTHLLFHLSNGECLCFIDTRRFGKWKLMDSFSFSPNRGPCILSSNDYEFSQSVISKVDTGKFDHSYILEMLMSQSLFNGVGNYLRAEIIERSGVNPFKKFGTLTGLEFSLLLTAVQTVSWESYQRGGGQLKDWKNPFGKDSAKFKEWLTTYGKGSKLRDRNGRNFWFNPKWLESSEYQHYSNLGK